MAQAPMAVGTGGSRASGAADRAGEGGREFLRGVLESAGVIGLFLAFGLGLAGWLGAGGAGAPYARHAMSSGEEERGPVWLVDGYNVLCTGLLGGADREGWWRRERREALVAALARLDDPEAEVWVVFDGARAPDEPAPGGRVHSVFAPSADAWLVAQAGARGAGAVVVTADRKLAARVRHRGARVALPAELLRRCTG